MQIILTANQLDVFLMNFSSQKAMKEMVFFSFFLVVSLFMHENETLHISQSCFSSRINNNHVVGKWICVRVYFFLLKFN